MAAMLLLLLMMMMMTIMVMAMGMGVMLMLMMVMVVVVVVVVMLMLMVLAVMLVMVMVMTRMRLLCYGGGASEDDGSNDKDMEVLEMLMRMAACPHALAFYPPSDRCDKAAINQRPHDARHQVFSLTTFGGVAAYLRLVSNFSGVAAIAVTTTRKIVTIVLSFLLFPDKVFCVMMSG